MVTSGDPLQFPPVPATSSLLAEPEGQTKEHRIAQSMFEDQDYVCELTSTMRFQGGPVLTHTIAEMRTPGEGRTSLRLAAGEWRWVQIGVKWRGWVGRAYKGERIGLESGARQTGSAFGSAAMAAP